MNKGDLAEPGQRLLARVVDTLVVGLPVVLVTRSQPLGLSRENAELAAVLGVAGLSLLYETVQLALWGRTLGKRFAGIQVVRVIGGKPEQEDPPNPGGLGLTRALLRSATYAMPIAARPVPVLGIVAGLFWVGNAAALFEGSLRQALHDRLAGTLVTRRHVPIVSSDGSEGSGGSGGSA